MSSKKTDVQTEETNDSIMSAVEFRVGYDNQNDPDVMIFNVPLKRCAEDIELGSALVRGKLDEAKQLALKHIAAKRARKAATGGIMRPGGIPTRAA